ncbi:FAD/NAD-binding domain-containing protein [Schizopora paradoxa]|uniref:FAD/NAD-binding domain-containing protein n=1 Tax=Schizopora paradoxa TaxID=27342 RepID=A0A0H2S5K2_9AGAM|nr:FAD/NAD-binding domain-containing protein [Schizopora paradoxa]
MPSPKLRVAICGGGIGGLALALVLHKFSKQDIQVDLYESKNGFSEFGAGITIWKRTWHILKLLGLEGSIGQIAVHPPVDAPKPGFAFRLSDSGEATENFYRIIAPFGSITVHRADMAKILVDKLPEGFRSHFSKRLVHYTENDRNIVTMTFADGTTAEADILIGADGVKSFTREKMYRDLAKAAEKNGDIAKAKQLEDFILPSWTGTYAYRSLVETEKLLKAQPGHQAATTPLMYLGKGRHIVSYPISRGKLINLIGFVSHPEKEGTKLEGPAVIDVPREEMISPYAGFETEARQLMECVESSSRWGISHIRGLPQYVSGRVALLGDSAHAMTTNIGAGAGQAIEDAYILGLILSEDVVNSSNLSAALKVYDSIRRPIGNAFVERSRSMGLAYEFNHIPEPAQKAGVEPSSPEGLKYLADFIFETWTANWRELPDKDWNEAQQLIQEHLSPR